MAKLTTKSKASLEEFSLSVYDDTKLPDLSGYRICVLPGAFHGSIEQMFRDAGADVISHRDYTRADVVVFSGGADVDPSTYRQSSIAETYGNKSRDDTEEKIYRYCVHHEIPMFGICRGLQFLHAMNDGTLWQHVENHGSSHLIYDVEFDIMLKSTSIHHQMVKNDAPNMRVIAVANRPTGRIGGGDKSVVTPLFKDATGVIKVGKGDTFKLNGKEFEGAVPEIEAAIYEKTNCVGVQGHPEVDTNGAYASWSLRLLKDFLENK